MKQSQKAKDLNLVQESNEKYHSHPYLSFSSFKTLIDHSPKKFHWEHILGNKPEPTKATKFGILAHSAIVEPQRFLENYTIQPEFDKRTKEGKAGFAEWQRTIKPSTIVMTKDESDDIIGMINSIRAYPEAAALLRKGIPEHSAYVVDSEFGVGLRARPDYIREDGDIVELKTAEDASLEGFTRSLGNYLYPVQAAFHMRVLKQATKKPLGSYIWLVVEKKAPYCCAIYVADNWILEKGEDMLRRGITKYKECVDKNEWPFQKGPQNISLPSWMIYEDNFI